MIDTIDRRLSFITLLVFVLCVVLVMRLVALQIQLSPEDVAYLDKLRQQSYVDTRTEMPDRGEIYDRSGQLLATNTIEYQVGISTDWVVDEVAELSELAYITNRDPAVLWEQWLAAEADPDQMWYPLDGGPVDLAEYQAIQALDFASVGFEQVARRYYPQGTLAGQILGFVNLEGQGYYGVEGYYNTQLAGRVDDAESVESTIPFEAAYIPPPQRGADIVLTIDRDVQFLAEEMARQGMETYQAESAMIIVMNPHTGEILAMASTPGFDPNQFMFYVEDDSEATQPQNESSEPFIINPMVSSIYEPGSVFKVLTMACALEIGIVTPEHIYNDEGLIEVGGREIRNWDERAYGQQDMTQLLVRSLNVGAAMLSTTMGPTRFYTCLETFNIGAPTGIDLQGEGAGKLKQPGDPDWSESELGTNSFGQGVAVTPIQMLTAVSAVANDGLLVRPHIIYQQATEDGIFTAQPQYLGRPISERTAQQLTEMMINVVEYGAPNAVVPGYSVAGKTGTAQIPIIGDYEEEDTIASFIGFLPADDPQVSVLVRLDRPKTSIWGTQTAAPLFSAFAQRLVVLLEIPPDDARHQIEAVAQVEQPGG